jgi:hypothetical protein
MLTALTEVVNVNTVNISRGDQLGGLYVDRGAHSRACCDRSPDGVAAYREEDGSKMKAAVIYENGDPEVLRYEDVAEPECPDGFVVVDAEAISIEGGDLLARAEGYLPEVPHVVGYLSAGTVSEVGAGVEGVSVGDRVVARNDAGSHASRRVVSAGMTWPIPPGLDTEHGPRVPLHRG